MRTVTKLLKTTCEQLTTTGGAIGEVLYDLWASSGSGEAVAAEAFAVLDEASRMTSNEKRMRFWLYQERGFPIRPLFAEAMEQTERKDDE